MAAQPHILLVDDHASTLEVLRMCLERKSFTVDTASTVASALLKAQQHPYDLLISDIGLPDGTGIELLKKIRETTPLPAIAMSGYAFERDIQACMDAGYDAHLTKPFDLTRLIGAVNEVLAP